MIELNGTKSEPSQYFSGAMLLIALALHNNFAIPVIIRSFLN